MNEKRMGDFEVGERFTNEIMGSGKRIEGHTRTGAGLFYAVRFDHGAPAFLPVDMTLTPVGAGREIEPEQRTWNYGRYNVVPRYTAGSPGVVDEATGKTVASEERHAYERIMTGLYGEGEKRRAERLGLHGIVYRYREIRRRVRLHDEITDEQREFENWEAFSRWSQRNRADTSSPIPS